MERDNKPLFVVITYTGNRDLAGTDATVKLQLFDDRNNSTPPIDLSHTFVDDFERGKIDTFKLRGQDTAQLSRTSKITELELRIENCGVLSDWYVDKVEVQNLETNETFLFPVFRWIRKGVVYRIQHLDTSLPQGQPKPVGDARKAELRVTRSLYELDQKLPAQFPGGPCQVKKVPQEEHFQLEEMLTIGKQAIKLKKTADYTKALKLDIKCLDDIKKIYSGDFNIPERASFWRSDEYFAMQRVAGLNHSIIELVTSIPSKFPVTDDLLQPFLEGLTLAQALEKKRLFMCDLHLMDGLLLKENRKLCAPIALFFLNTKNTLRPVAIQLNQRPGIDNPIFTPGCPTWTWTLVKMWFNHADALYHQALTHLGFTHLLMEGFSLATHRQLSVSHPVFKILAPHFLYLHAINSLALSELLDDGGWVDKTTSYGNTGMYQLVERGFQQWSVEQHGLLHNDLRRRGVDDPEVLPNYPYRDDATLLYDAISEYVNSYIDLYYKDNETLQADYEVQHWVKELAEERNFSEGGIGILGLPVKGSLTSLDQLKDIVVCIIYTCSVGHAATNFIQYDEYGFPPNYPLTLNKHMLKDFVATEADVVKALPDIVSIMDSLTITKILSTKSTKSLGYFEVQFIYDPKAIAIVNSFRKRLEEISEIIDKRNIERHPSYNYLDPKYIPNAISI
ncbi:allene oxide synthase-lipoxygenase protein-like [Physella acuta]|uniref:allene oxide synthase-lipoxygenase protein-like n=1 Tax=Physella acuta TaxID=109671 RepID=UPI0027DE4F0D|nr:allene oxide synthase-lipoxygenase protein-like [Physella acuta]